MLKKLRDCFPETAAAASALELLDKYGVESWQREQDRVQLAILKLSGGDLSTLHSLVELAISDYRDVLAPAEYPEECQSGFRPPSDHLDAVRARDREQYVSWLKADGC